MEVASATISLEYLDELRRQAKRGEELEKEKKGYVSNLRQVTGMAVESLLLAQGKRVGQFIMEIDPSRGEIVSVKTHLIPYPAENKVDVNVICNYEKDRNSRNEAAK